MAHSVCPASYLFVEALPATIQFLRGGLTLCVPKCNGVRDCVDGSDELGCPCPSNEIACGPASRKRCVRKSYKCDGDNVGRSLSDQLSKAPFLCDSSQDCGDWSDEIGCPCKAGKVACPFKEDDKTKKRVCITKSALCDGYDVRGGIRRYWSSQS